MLLLLVLLSLHPPYKSNPLKGCGYFLFLFSFMGKSVKNRFFTREPDPSVVRLILVKQVSCLQHMSAPPILLPSSKQMRRFLQNVWRQPGISSPCSSRHVPGRHTVVRGAFVHHHARLCFPVLLCQAQIISPPVGGTYSHFPSVQSLSRTV